MQLKIKALARIDIVDKKKQFIVWSYANVISVKSNKINYIPIYCFSAFWLRSKFTFLQLHNYHLTVCQVVYV